MSQVGFDLNVGVIKKGHYGEIVADDFYFLKKVRTGEGVMSKRRHLHREYKPKGNIEQGGGGLRKIGKFGGRHTCTCMPLVSSMHLTILSCYRRFCLPLPFNLQEKVSHKLYHLF